MNEKAAIVLKKIKEKGFDAYFVGGYPRDICMNRPCVDIDICTNATPKDLKEIFKDAVISNIQYGSVTVIYQKVRFEITTYRKEFGYKDYRKPTEIFYIDSLEEDLKRRDFTINTLCMDEYGNIKDLLGGIEAIDKKEIIMVGDPKIRLKEDVLRILRAIRFATTLNFNIDSNLKKYIIEYGSLLSNLSFHRKKEELNKIFMSENNSYGIQLIKELNLDKSLLLNNLNNVVVTSSSFGIWAQLDVLDIYPFTSSEKKIINSIKKLLDKDILDSFVLYQNGLYICCLVGEIKKIDKKEITKKYNSLPIHSRKDIVVTSMEISYLLNKKAGPYLNDIYKDLEYKILKGTLFNEKEELKKYILENYL